MSVTHPERSDTPCGMESSIIWRACAGLREGPPSDGPGRPLAQPVNTNSVATAVPPTAIGHDQRGISSWSAHQLQRLWQLCQQLIAELGTDVKESHARELVGTIFPSVIRAMLNHYVTLVQRDLAVIQNEDHLALDGYSVIESLCPMHHGALASGAWRIDIDDPYHRFTACIMTGHNSSGLCHRISPPPHGPPSYRHYPPAAGRTPDSCATILARSSMMGGAQTCELGDSVES